MVKFRTPEYDFGMRDKPRLFHARNEFVSFLEIHYTEGHGQLVRLRYASDNLYLIKVGKTCPA